MGFLLSRPLTVDSMFLIHLKTLIPLVSFYTPWKTSENLWYFKNNIKQKTVITSQKKQIKIMINNSTDKIILTSLLKYRNSTNHRVKILLDITVGESGQPEN